MKTINFYRCTQAYGCFSNFSPHPVNMKGQVWPTSEHYFQSQKFVGTSHEEEIRKCDTPSKAAKMGRSLPLRKDWESVKDDVMKEVIFAKFSQHTDLKEILLSTESATLIEHTTNDSYWADGGNGSGKNMLGKILMQAREQLKK